MMSICIQLEERMNVFFSGKLLGVENELTKINYLNQLELKINLNY